MSWKRVRTPEGCPESFQPISTDGTRESLRFMAEQLDRSGKGYFVQTVTIHPRYSRWDVVRIWSEPAKGRGEIRTGSVFK